LYKKSAKKCGELQILQFSADLHPKKFPDDWHAKLTGLPSILTDKIRSKLYKRYKKETGNEP
jgi:hypothetical protein